MNFDRIARHYDWLEAFTAGDRLQRARVRWLEELAGCRRVLSVGEGHGRFAEAFVERFPGIELTCLEASAGMRARAQRRLGGRGKVRWIAQDVRDWKPDGAYDAIVAGFFLDCLGPEELGAVVTRLGSAAANDAMWLVVDFAVPETPWLARWRAQAVHALMYGWFRAVVGLPARRLTPPDAALRRAGFELVGREEWEWGLIRSEVWRAVCAPRKLQRRGKA